MENPHVNPLVKQITDAGQRAADVINEHISKEGLVNCIGWWVALRLSDGGSDGVMYDTHEACVYHQLHETMCAYVQIRPDTNNPRELSRYLAICRKVYASGHKLSDPHNDPIAAIHRSL